MKKLPHLLIILLFLVIPVPGSLFAQVSGNISYAKQHQRGGKEIKPDAHQVHLNDSSMLVKARVLLNAPAETFVAVLGLQEEGNTPQECRDKLQKRIEGFLSALRSMGIQREDYYVDFIAQNRIYDYEVSGSIAIEKLSGFELKKNISVRLDSENQVEPLVARAAEFGIYDLIKVDYIIQDIAGIKKQLFEEAFQLVEEKKNRYLSRTGLKLAAQSQIYSENYATQVPSQAYGSFTAYESGQASTAYNKTKVRARKMSTFFYDPMGMDHFDKVIGPLILKPVVQFTYELQVKYDIVK